jgi:hypothetical protein
MAPTPLKLDRRSIPATPRSRLARSSRWCADAQETPRTWPSMRGGIVVPHLAIIDAERWEAVQRVNEQSRQQPTGGPSNKYQGLAAPEGGSTVTLEHERGGSPRRS